MGPRHKHRFWHKCRVYFRRVRIAVWLLILALVGAVVYLNQVGLPAVVKRPLLQKLRENGVDLQFSRLRWRWHQGIVAEQVRFGTAAWDSGERVTADVVEMRLNLHALAQLRVQVDGLMIRGGQLVCPVSKSNEPPRELRLHNLETELHFLPNDRWALGQLSAEFA
jgi:hypothetical protein